MANENLQNALFDAGLSAEQFAEVIRVDPKSVQRWLTGDTVPYPKHRKAITRALNLSEQELWPELAPPESAQADADGPSSLPEESCDVVGSWAYADDDSVPDLVAFITDSDGPIDLLDNYCGIEFTAELADALAAQAAAGNAVRVLSGVPSEHLRPLITEPQAEVRVQQIWVEFWFLRASERMLFAINFQNDVAELPPPVLELDGTIEGGLYDRAIDKFDELWQHAQEDKDTLLDSGEQLDQALSYINGSDGNPADETHQNSDDQPVASPPAYGQTQTPSPFAPADPSSQAERRRWPRQPQ